MKFNRKLIFCLSISTLVGCGGGSSSQAPTANSNLPTPTPTPAPTPAPPATVGTPPSGSCSTNSQLIYIPSVLSDNVTLEASGADNIADHDLNTAWTSDEANASFTLDLSENYKVDSIRIAWRNGEQTQHNFTLTGSADNTGFYDIATLQSSGSINLPEVYDIDDTNLRYLKLETNFTSATNAGISEVFVIGCPLDGTAIVAPSNFSLSALNLNPDVPPGENFDLLTWGLDNPEDNDNNGRSDRISERDLDNGFENEFFYTGEDGGMVFNAPIYAPKTSTNTSYARTELREMLRRGNTSISTQGQNENNWVLGYQPEVTQPIGGRGGRLSATMAVNYVARTGENFQLGRFIIGQIHAGDDEPIRLYYRKRPEHQTGYIYFAHEINGGDDILKMVYGPEYGDFSNQPNFTSEPSVGFSLDEIFSYEIIQEGARIDVLIRKGGLSDPIVGHQFIDMNEVNSGYDVQDEWMYFKAGAYTGNNSGDPEEYFQATFYQLINTHPAN